MSENILDGQILLQRLTKENLAHLGFVQKRKTDLTTGKNHVIF